MGGGGKDRLPSQGPTAAHPTSHLTLLFLPNHEIFISSWGYRSHSVSYLSSETLQRYYLSHLFCCFSPISSFFYLLALFLFFLQHAWLININEINQNFFLFPDNRGFQILHILHFHHLWFVWWLAIFNLISQDIVILRLNVVFCSYDSFRFIYFFKPFSSLLYFHI